MFERVEQDNSQLIFTQYCHSDEGGISVRSLTKIGDFDCGITCGDSSFVGMTNFVDIMFSKYLTL